jgi:hypothetical protein
VQHEGVSANVVRDGAFERIEIGLTINDKLTAWLNNKPVNKHGRFTTAKGRSEKQKGKIDDAGPHYTTKLRIDEVQKKSGQREGWPEHT